MLTCYDVANYFLAKYGTSSKENDLISNLKLQKLVYYAQGFSIALFDEPLFDDPIEAWDYGPVVSALYQSYKTYKSDALPTPSNFDESIYPKHIGKLLDDVYCEYGQFSAWKLRDMTHEEEPWLQTYEAGKNKIISTSLLKSFFRTQVSKINHYSFTYDLERITQRVNDNFDTIPNLASAKDIEQWLMQ